MRWGLEEAQSKRAGRRTGTGYEVWYTRDERARDREVLHPQRGVLYKSGVYAPNAEGDGHKIIRFLLSLSRLGSPHAQIVRTTLQSSSPWAILTL